MGEFTCSLPIWMKTKAILSKINLFPSPSSICVLCLPGFCSELSTISVPCFTEIMDSQHWKNLLIQTSKYCSKRPSKLPPSCNKACQDASWIRKVKFHYHHFNTIFGNLFMYIIFCTNYRKIRLGVGTFNLPPFLDSVKFFKGPRIHCKKGRIKWEPKWQNPELSYSKLKIRNPMQ